jgi:catechol 2,3-dioxygenase-like lactoylglutathione lyase family enzyme
MNERLLSHRTAECERWATLRWMDSGQSSTSDATPRLTRRLDHVYYWVADMDRAVAFYRDVLDLPLVRQSGDEWAEFDCGEARLALHGAVHGHAPPPGGATAVFLVDDLDDARAALSARGVTFGHEGGVEGFARFLAFADPDGNTVQVIEYEPRG